MLFFCLKLRLWHDFGTISLVIEQFRRLTLFLYRLCITVNDTRIRMWARAYAKRILLISPTNLMGAVKMVCDLWKRDQQSKNALEIARQGERLYEKFIGFLNNMDDIGSHIIKTQDAFNRALGQLKQSKGNLIGRAEKLKQLGSIKSSKSLPAIMMSYISECVKRSRRFNRQIRNTHHYSGRF